MLESESEKKDNPDTKDESKEKQPVATPDASTSTQDNTETKENIES